MNIEGLVGITAKRVVGIAVSLYLIIGLGMRDECLDDIEVLFFKLFVVARVVALRFDSNFKSLSLICRIWSQIDPKILLFFNLSSSLRLRGGCLEIFAFNSFFNDLKIWMYSSMDWNSSGPNDFGVRGSFLGSSKIFILFSLLMEFGLARLFLCDKESASEVV